MPGFVTSYAGLFSPTETNAPGVTSIEIPLIQRDYAQGRTDARTSEAPDTVRELQGPLRTRHRVGRRQGN